MFTQSPVLPLDTLIPVQVESLLCIAPIGTSNSSGVNSTQSMGHPWEGCQPHGRQWWARLSGCVGGPGLQRRGKSDKEPATGLNHSGPFLGDRIVTMGWHRPIP